MSTILVVDDSAIDRKLVGGMLSKEPGLKIAYAEHGVAALAHMALTLPDLVLTDLIMPEMDGLELVATVRSKYPQVPTVLMTSKGSEEIAVQALKRGAASYVPKRVLARELVETIAGVLALSRQALSYTRLMSCMARSECEFILDNDRALLSSLVGYFQEEVTQIGLCDEVDRMHVGVALEEALVNALFHGNLEVSSELREEDYEAYQTLAEARRQQLPYQSRQIHVAAKLSPQQATFVIRDEGPGFDPSALPDPTDAANLEKVSGRGVLLMRTFMDAVVYNARGNEVALTKYGNPALRGGGSKGR